MPQSSFDAVNVTPLIDVVMCMIIFFLIVGKLATDRGLPVTLPKSPRGAEETSASVLVLTIAKFELAPERITEQSAFWRPYGITVQLDGETMTDAKALETAIRGKLASAPSTSIQIRGHSGLNFGAVEPVLRTCGQAGAKSVRLAAERAEP